jgi:hypothetical protein
MPRLPQKTPRLLAKSATVLARSRQVGMAASVSPAIPARSIMLALIATIVTKISQIKNL